MTKNYTHELDQIEWRRVGVTSIVTGTALAIAAILAVLAISQAGKWLGWPNHLVQLSSYISVAALTLPYIYRAAHSLRAVSQDDTSDGFTTAEIASRVGLAAQQHKRRQMLKTALGLVLAALGTGNIVGLILIRQSVIQSFQSIFGSSAEMNFWFLQASMAMLALGGVGIAARAWLNRTLDGEEQVIAALEDLENDK